MTENELRNQYVNKAKEYLGASEGSSKHHEIVDIYNSQNPLPVGYAVKYTDDWCATFTSAMAVLCDLTDIILPECSCTRMCALYEAVSGKKSTSYSPKTGDLIIYDWDPASGNGPEHIGIIVSNSGGNLRVIEGNKNNTVEYRDISTSYDYIYCYLAPDYASKATGTEDTSDAKKIWDYLLAKLGNKYGVAGLMGNLEAESGLHADRVQGDIPYSNVSVEYTAKVDNGTISRNDFIHNGPGGGGYGLAQWTYYTRKASLYDLWKSGGYSSIGSLDLALDYLWTELTNDYPGVVSVLKSATSVREASDKVLHDFENPADQSTAVEEKRASMGQVWYDKYVNSTPGDGGDTPTPDPPTPERPTWTPSSKKKMALLLMVAGSQRRGS